jgi:Fe-S oxidoreductase
MENKTQIKVRTFAELSAEGKTAEYLFWVGSAGSFDDRAKKITRDFVKILESAKVDYAVLGEEETDTGDSARRAGNEFLFQMQAMQNIEILNAYEIKKIITCDPHDYNTLLNEYPDLGGKYELIHHTEFIKQLIDEKKIIVNNNEFKNKSITYHDPCYLGRGNNIYDAPRSVIKSTNCNLVEMTRNKSRALCCGAGGAQMFKEPENGEMEVFELRTMDALETNPEVIITACPFCMTMLTDGIKLKEKEEEIEVLDIAELIVKANSL